MSLIPILLASAFLFLSKFANASLVVKENSVSGEKNRITDWKSNSFLCSQFYYSKIHEAISNIWGNSRPQKACADNLNVESWVLIFSFVQCSYDDYLKYCRLSKGFNTVLSSVGKLRKRNLFALLSKYQKIDFSDCFWNGLQDYFPLLNEKLPAEDCFVAHLCRSLEECDVDPKRLDRVLFYLYKKKVFHGNGLLSKRYPDYAKSFCSYIWMNINDVNLYRFLGMEFEETFASEAANEEVEDVNQEVEDANEGDQENDHNEVESNNNLLVFSQVNPLTFFIEEREEFIHRNFRTRQLTLFWYAQYSKTGWLKLRLQLLYFVHEYFWMFLPLYFLVAYLSTLFNQIQLKLLFHLFVSEAIIEEIMKPLDAVLIIGVTLAFLIGIISRSKAFSIILSLDDYYLGQQKSTLGLKFIHLILMALIVLYNLNPSIQLKPSVSGYVYNHSLKSSVDWFQDFDFPFETRRISCNLARTIDSLKLNPSETDLVWRINPGLAELLFNFDLSETFCGPRERSIWFAYLHPKKE